MKSPSATVFIDHHWHSVMIAFSMKEAPRRSTTVSSSLNEISTDQLGNKVVVRGRGVTHPFLQLYTRGPNSNRMHGRCNCTFSVEKSTSGFRILPQIFKIFKDYVNGFPPSRISALGHCNDAKERHSPISSGQNSVYFPGNSSPRSLIRLKQSIWWHCLLPWK